MKKDPDVFHVTSHNQRLALAIDHHARLGRQHDQRQLLHPADKAVRVLALGEGFSLEGEGQALSNGIEGQPARVRTESGRILTGQPVGDRRLEVAL